MFRKLLSRAKGHPRILVETTPMPQLRQHSTREADKENVGGAAKPAACSSIAKSIHILRSHWFRCLLLLLIGFIVRSPALQGQSIWDDQYLVHGNPFIKSPLLILETFRHYLFLDSSSAHYRPIQNITYFIDYYFWNTDEFGFHLSNVILHVASSILLYFLLRQLLASLYFRNVRPAIRPRLLKRMPWISHGAFLVALLWAVHPVHSAAIDYISGRADSLAFLFSAGGWLLFLRAQSASRRSARVGLCSLAAISGLVALLSREIACVWILVFIAHLFFVERRLRFRVRLSALVCCLGLVLIYVACRQLPGHRAVSPSRDSWAAPVRAVLMVRALGDYARLLIFPENLHLERTVLQPTGFGNNATWRTSISTEYLSILGLLLLIAFAVGSLKKGSGQVTRVFGASWFLAAYLPISNIVQLNATVAEHWLYLPSVGFLIFLFGCGLELPARYRRNLGVAAAFAIIAFGFRSFVRSRDWVDEETFYRRALETGSRSARIAINLSDIYAARGSYSLAEKIIRSVIEQNPDYPVAQNNLANILYHEGKIAEAEALFASIDKNSAETRSEYSRTWIGALNLAHLRYKARNYASAISILDRARKEYPDIWEIISSESEVLRQTQGADAALQLVEAFAKRNWWDGRATLALGRLYAQKGDVDRAVIALRHASWLDIHDTEALRLMVQIRMGQNRLEDAVNLQRRAIARQPDEPHQYIQLSQILDKMGRADEARTVLAEASRLVSVAQNQTILN